MNYDNKKVVAIFDFDGTLTKGDTFLPFLYYSFGAYRTLFGLIYLSPFILAYLVKIISNDRAKSKMINFFLKNKDVAVINRNAIFYIDKKLEKYLRKNIINRLKWHQSKSHTTILISASLDVYVKPWANKLNFNFVEATKLVRDKNLFTGKIDGNNCYGKEKVRRLKKILGNDFSEYEVYGYGDGDGDKYFLELCDHKYFKNDIKEI